MERKKNPKRKRVKTGFLLRFGLKKRQKKDIICGSEVRKKNMKEMDIQAVLETYEELNLLKTLKRQGWKDWSIEKEKSESVADHIYGCQMLAWCILEQTDLHLDVNKIMAMISLHETEEIKIGDITPFDGMTQEEKKKLGKEAVHQTLSKLPKSSQMQALIDEFEEGKTPEAKFAHLCDKLECDLQAYLYQKEGLLKWYRVDEKVKEDKRIKKLQAQGTKTIAQMFLDNDAPLYQNTVFQEIADFVRKQELKGMKTALVLEGGALRGMYTSGVLDAFLEENLPVDCVVGVSAGALNAMNYVSGQKGRSAQINLTYCDNPKYIGREAIARSKGIIGFDYLFEEISKKEIPFDEEAFAQSKIRCVSCVTNCTTGKAEYYEKSEMKPEKYNRVVQASSSMPLASRRVKLGKDYYLDGAVADSVPVDWAIQEGYDNIIVVLTRDKKFRKKLLTNKEKQVYRLAYKSQPKLIEKLLTMPERYNALRERMDTLEKEGKIYILRPQKEVTVGRLEKDKKKLQDLYDEGYTQAKKELKAMKKYMERK